MNEMPPDEFFGVEADTEVAPRARPPLRVVPAGARDPRQEIALSSNVHEVSNAMAAAVGGDPELYQRGGSLVHVVRAEGSTDGTGPTAGTPQTRNVPLSMMVTMVSRRARCMRRSAKTGEWSHVPPPRDMAQAVLEQGQWSGVRTIAGILEAPSMRPDGTILQTPGHDAATGFLYEPNASFLEVADEPTHSDAARAWVQLREPFEDFPYVNESHRSAVISALLTVLARPAIRGSVPCWLFDASARRSGKSMQTDVIALVCTGRQASRTTYPADDAELEKILSSYAAQGANTVNFDNVDRTYGGAALDKCVTATDLVDMRPLGSSRIVSYPWRAVIFASGNNVSCRGDMLPRVLAPRLETPLEHPEKRSDFKIADLRAWVSAHRAELVHAALTLLRAYVVAGRPDEGAERWGGFEGWASFIPNAIRWVGGEDPTGARRGGDGDDDPEECARGALVEGWARLSRHEPLGLTSPAAIKLLYPTGRHEEREPDGYDDLREAIEILTPSRPGVSPSARQLGEALRYLMGRTFGGKRITRTPGGRVARWRAI